MEEQTISQDENQDIKNEDESVEEQKTTQTNGDNSEEENNNEENDNSDDAISESTEYESRIKELTDALKETEKQKDELHEKWLRVHAEFENYKKRTKNEMIAERKYKSLDLATELLPVLDNFDRALQTEVSSENESFKEGMQMVYEQLKVALKSQGVEPIEALHQAFDPNVHHAVMQSEDEQFESNIVVEELQKGYTLKDKIIRPAMVKVNK